MHPFYHTDSAVYCIVHFHGVTRYSVIVVLLQICSGWAEGGSNVHYFVLCTVILIKCFFMWRVI